VRRDVVRRFVTAATSLTDRFGRRRTVGGGGETSGRRRGRSGTAAAAPGPRPMAYDRLRTRWLWRSYC